MQKKRNPNDIPTTGRLPAGFWKGATTTDQATNVMNKSITGDNTTRNTDSSDAANPNHNPTQTITPQLPSLFIRKAPLPKISDSGESVGEKEEKKKKKKKNNKSGSSLSESGDSSESSESSDGDDDDDDGGDDDGSNSFDGDLFNSNNNPNPNSTSAFKSLKNNKTNINSSFDLENSKYHFKVPNYSFNNYNPNPNPNYNPNNNSSNISSTNVNDNNNSDPNQNQNSNSNPNPNPNPNPNSNLKHVKKVANFFGRNTNSVEYHFTKESSKKDDESNNKSSKTDPNDNSNPNPNANLKHVKKVANFFGRNTNSVELQFNNDGSPDYTPNPNHSSPNSDFLCFSVRKSLEGSQDGLLRGYGVGSKEISLRIDSGDIFLFSSTHLLSYGTKLFTRSRWDHVALAVRWWDNEMKLLEATTLDGVETHNLDERLAVLDPGSVVAVRRLNVERTPKMISALYRFVDEVSGRPFQKNKATMLAAAGGLNTGEDTTSMFCSELVAEAYKRMSLFRQDAKTSNNFIPKVWASDSLPFAEGVSLSPKYLFKFK